MIISYFFYIKMLSIPKYHYFYHYSKKGGKMELIENKVNDKGVICKNTYLN